MGRAETDERILAGAMRALGRFGPRRLSLGDVCHEAQVSRATLFRYYRTKEELLTATAGHIERDFRAALTTAAEQAGDHERLEAVLSAMLTFRDSRPATTQLLSVEPGFVLEFLGRERPNFARILRDALGTALADVPVVRADRISETDLAEFLILVANAAFLVPSPRLGHLADLVTSLLGLDDRSEMTTATSAGSG
jgi:AcrR family transcriptional regulator